MLLQLENTENGKVVYLGTTTNDMGIITLSPHSVATAKKELGIPGNRALWGTKANLRVVVAEETKYNTWHSGLCISRVGDAIMLNGHGRSGCGSAYLWHQGRIMYAVPDEG